MVDWKVGPRGVATGRGVALKQSHHWLGTTRPRPLGPFYLRGNKAGTQKGKIQNYMCFLPTWNHEGGENRAEEESHATQLHIHEQDSGTRRAPPPEQRMRHARSLRHSIRALGSPAISPAKLFRASRPPFYKIAHH